MADFGDVNPDTGQTNARTDFEGTIDPYAPSVANGMITPEQWEEYQRQRRKAAILGILSVIGSWIALSGVGAAMSGAGAAGAGAGAGAGATSASSLPPVVGGAPWAVTPYAAPVAASGTGATVGAGLGAGALASGAGALTPGSTPTSPPPPSGGGGGGTVMGLTPQQLAALALTGVSTVGAATSNNNAPTSLSSATMDPSMQALIKTMQGRMAKSEPLYDSILSMANGLLPTQYQQKGGGGMP